MREEHSTASGWRRTRAGCGWCGAALRACGCVRRSGLVNDGDPQHLDNAVRYSRRADRVSVAVSAEAGEVHISVIDQGEGIAQEAHERIFERFYRGDRARSQETGGTGLGLSIVKHVATDHGGRVQVWSRPGQGSTFTMILPEAYIALTRVRGLGGSGRGGISGHGEGGTMTRILVVEDEPTYRDMPNSICCGMGSR